VRLMLEVNFGWRGSGTDLRARHWLGLQFARGEHPGLKEIRGLIRQRVPVVVTETGDAGDQPKNDRACKAKVWKRWRRGSAGIRIAILPPVPNERGEHAAIQQDIEDEARMRIVPEFKTSCDDGGYHNGNRKQRRRRPALDAAQNPSYPEDPGL